MALLPDQLLSMRKVFNKLVSVYLDVRYRQIEHFMKNPHEVQEQLFQQLLSEGKKTEYGKYYHFNSLNDYADFSKTIPINSYEDLMPYIERMMMGEHSILWPGQVKWFSKSSGTTSSKSKFIPVSSINLKHGHIKSSWDVVTLLYHNKPDSMVFAQKNLVMGGSISSYSKHPDTMYGDISGVMLENMPAIGRPFYTPDFETAVMADWDKKIDRMVDQCTKENVTMFGGVPTWTIVLFRKILEATGKNNIKEVWPDVQTYVHGGVSFEPYRDQFKAFLPFDEMNYVEVYNASEGYFAIQNESESNDLLLLLDNGNYYEFIPMTLWGTDQEKAVPLSEVSVGVHYALVITTTSGLWRYQPGDTIVFTNTSPYKIKITGRTKHFINVFGEELMVFNAEKALARTCSTLNCTITDYTVGPIFMKGTKGKGGHEWVIEFDKRPQYLAEFEELLDKNLQNLNSDYEAKRYKDMALHQLNVTPVEKGTFIEWLTIHNKVGAQNKIPRLSNSRDFLEQIKELHGTRSSR